MTDLLPKKLPIGWAEGCLGDIVQNLRPKEDPKGYRDLPFIGMEHVEAQTMRLLGTVPAATMSSHAVHFHPSDVLYGRLRPYLNKVFIADHEGMCSAEFIPLTASDGLEPRYLAYALNSAHFVSFASHINEGDRPRVDYGEIAGYRLAIAPSKEQNRIVAAIESYFTRLDAALASLERVEAKLKRYRASVLRAAVEGRLVPTEAELARKEGREYEPASVLLERILKERRRRWQEAGGRGKYQEPVVPETKRLPELPEGWSWTTVGAVGDVLLGRQRAPQYLTGQWSRPYLRVANIKDDVIDFSDIEEMDFDAVHFNKYRLEPGDILVSEGQSPELLGQSAIYRGGIEGLCFQKTLHRFRSVPGGPSSEFVQIVFRAHVKTGVFKRMGSITTNIAHLTLVKFEGAPFPLPPAAEQVRIVAETSRLLTIADGVDSSLLLQVARVHRLRQSILKWAFEGKLADQDPDDEPASLLLERIMAVRKKTQADNNGDPGRGQKRKTA